MRYLASAFFLCISCSNVIYSPAPPPPPGTPSLRPLGTFASPVFVTSPPGDTLRLFVVEQAGRIRVLRRDTLLGSIFLDLRGQINAGGEEGLLSLAFHPQYATNGRFYVYFTNDDGDIRIVRYNVSSGDANIGDESTADTVIKIGHPTFGNHNGGQLQFGPDGKLYAAIGDGGSGGDPSGNGQNKHALLGKLLRLDVDGASGYTIPADNPFATDTTAEPEIWAIGLRNPWRFSFDRQTGDLYIADVGQGAWEEVSVSPSTGPGTAGKGANYGWRTMEGAHCYPIGSQCTPIGVLPVTEYDHSGGACSITGGYVYRGTKITALAGKYIYADFCAGFVRSFRYVGGQASNPEVWTMNLNVGGQVSSFGEDADGDLYIMSLGGGVYRIIPSP